MLELVERQPMKVRVVDRNGTVEVFPNAIEASRALHCTKSYVYFAIRTGRKIAGCEVKKSNG